MSDITHYYGDDCDPPHVEGPIKLPANPSAREWLEDIHSCSSGDTTDPGAALRLTAAALLAVLDLHREQIGLDDVLRYCYDCEEGWPCATVRAINKTLGVTDE